MEVCNVLALVCLVWTGYLQQVKQLVWWTPKSFWAFVLVSLQREQPIWCFWICRMYLGYHTTRQVGWGALTGAVLGSLWFCVVQLLLTPFFPTVASWWVSRQKFRRIWSLTKQTLSFVSMCFSRNCVQQNFHSCRLVYACDSPSLFAGQFANTSWFEILHSYPT